MRVVLIYLLLLVAAIPWYWPADATALVFGIPLWVAVSLLVALAVSALTAWLLVRAPSGSGDG
jgi:hypothetical protein